MAKQLVKSDMNRVIKRLAAHLDKIHDQAFNHLNTRMSDATAKEKNKAQQRMDKHTRIRATLARLRVIADTPTSLTQAMLADAWDAMVDIAMEMNWPLDDSDGAPGVFVGAYALIDELRTTHQVDSTAPTAYAA